jgi:hypothetical protein
MRGRDDGVLSSCTLSASVAGHEGARRRNATRRAAGCLPPPIRQEHPDRSSCQRFAHDRVETPPKEAWGVRRPSRLVGVDREPDQAGVPARKRRHRHDPSRPAGRRRRGWRLRQRRHARRARHRPRRIPVARSRGEAATCAASPGFVLNRPRRLDERRGSRRPPSPTTCRERARLRGIAPAPAGV